MLLSIVLSLTASVPEAPLKMPPPVEPVLFFDRLQSWSVAVPRL
jgi:hypothetical protein